MVSKTNNHFVIETKNLSYIFHINDVGYLVHDYFANKIVVEDFNALGQKQAYPKGSATVVDEDIDPNFSADYSLLEYSFSQKGDYREPGVVLKSDSRGYTFDFRYHDYRINNQVEEIKTIPMPHNLDEELVIVLKEQVLDIYLELHYYISFNHDVIVRNVVLINKTKEDITLEKIMSMQLDMNNKDFDLVNLSGGWINETHEYQQKIHPGIYINDSKVGLSSNKHNPFFMIVSKDVDVDRGECYSFNLMYSGNHQELVELNVYGNLHIQSGINPYMFSYKVRSEESFVTPFAIMTYSSEGTNTLGQRMRDFVNDCVINENFGHRLRPIVINNWEGTYFKFNQRKLLSIAKKASKFGVELFVLDDGWFSNRNDDYHGLGDYDVNKKKLPSGLSGLAKKINKLGMKFGLWFEPESINIESKLYKSHPEYVIQTKDVKPSRGRHQLTLDLTKVEVQDYIIENISNTLRNANIEYVKWDMNKNISDINKNSGEEGEFYHRYVLGLYRVISTLTSQFPHILFENCSSGGNRFDLGMLKYFPQTWASDCSDSYERISIQQGLSYGYPLSSISAHVSHRVNHQTLRVAPYSSKFDVASFGVLGYELMLNELTKVEQKEIKNQIAFYKEHRELFQYGDFYIVKPKKYEGDSAMWMVQSKDHKEAIIGYFNGLQSLCPKETFLKGYNFLKGKQYSVEVMNQPHNIKKFGNLVNMILPIHVNSDGSLINLVSKHISLPMEKESFKVDGELLNRGVQLKSEWAGNGYDDNVRVLGDFGARLYFIKMVE